MIKDVNRLNTHYKFRFETNYQNLIIIQTIKILCVINTPFYAILSYLSTRNIPNK
jgi:hypothetical protein